MIYPTTSTVSRALNRDAGIRATPRTRPGYHVVGGNGASSIAVDLSDHPESAEDERAARDLCEFLRTCGWHVYRADRVHLYVHHVPTLAEQRARAASSTR